MGVEHTEHARRMIGLLITRIYNCILCGGTHDVPATCPSGFSTGYICLDTDDNNNGKD
jgi:hypothetical protein